MPIENPALLDDFPSCKPPLTEDFPATFDNTGGKLIQIIHLILVSATVQVNVEETVYSNIPMYICIYVWVYIYIYIHIYICICSLLNHDLLWSPAHGSVRSLGTGHQQAIDEAERAARGYQYLEKVMADGKIGKIHWIYIYTYIYSYIYIAIYIYV